MEKAAGANDAKTALHEAISSKVEDCHVDCHAWPVRYVSGGVLPIVKIRKRKYCLLFYRVSDPWGWNLANGGAIDARELQDPTLIIEREFGEEVLAVNTSRKIIYRYEPPRGVVQPGYQQQAISRWPSYETKDMPVVEWRGGPDTVKVTVYGDKRKKAKDVFLSITPEDSGIEVDRVVVIKGTEDMVFVDGDVTRVHPTGRLAGLFDFAKLKDKDLDADDFIPDVLFFDTRKFPPGRSGFDQALRDYFNAIDAKLPPGEPSKHKDPSDYPAQFCPITKELIRRYTGALKNGHVKKWKPK